MWKNEISLKNWPRQPKKPKETTGENQQSSRLIDQPSDTRPTTWADRPEKTNWRESRHKETGDNFPCTKKDHFEVF